MNLRVRLSRLDDIGSIKYDKRFPVLLNNYPAKVIGEGTIYLDSTGHFFADLILNDTISKDWYFYYNNDNTIEEYYFTGISLHEKPRQNQPTTTLAEMII